MKHRLLSVTLLSAGVVWGVGCENPKKPRVTELPYESITSPAQTRAVEIRSKMMGQNLEGEVPPFPASMLIKSEEALAKAGGSSLRGLKVDFDDEAVVLVSLGEQPGVGYWVQITDVQQAGDTLYVQYTVNRPEGDLSSGGGMESGVSRPFAAAVVPDIGAKNVRSDARTVVGQAMPAEGM